MLPIDQATCEVYPMFLAKRSDAEKPYIDEYKPWIRQQRQPRGIKVLMSGCGGEFKPNSFIAHTKQQGTVRNFTMHNSPQSNGAAERINRTIINMVRVYLAGLALANKHGLWAEAI
jgi:hypothetical protein